MLIWKSWLTSTYSSFKDDNFKTQREYSIDIILIPSIEIRFGKDSYSSHVFISIWFEWLIFKYVKSWLITLKEK